VKALGKENSGGADAGRRLVSLGSRVGDLRRARTWTSCGGRSRVVGGFRCRVGGGLGRVVADVHSFSVLARRRRIGQCDAESPNAPRSSFPGELARAEIFLVRGEMFETH